MPKTLIDSTYAGEIRVLSALEGKHSRLYDYDTDPLAEPIGYEKCPEGEI